MHEGSLYSDVGPIPKVLYYVYVHIPKSEKKMYTLLVSNTCDREASAIICFVENVR